MTHSFLISVLQERGYHIKKKSRFLIAKDTYAIWKINITEACSAFEALYTYKYHSDISLIFLLILSNINAESFPGKVFFTFSQGNLLLHLRAFYYGNDASSFTNFLCHLEENVAHLFCEYNQEIKISNP